MDPLRIDQLENRNVPFDSKQVTNSKIGFLGSKDSSRVNKLENGKEDNSFHFSNCRITFHIG